MQSATRLTFGDEHTLFVADWKGARIYALPVTRRPKRPASRST
jgi:sugar lactone lactonase YvrE